MAIVKQHENGFVLIPETSQEYQFFISLLIKDPDFDYGVDKYIQYPIDDHEQTTLFFYKKDIADRWCQMLNEFSAFLVKKQDCIIDRALIDQAISYLEKMLKKD
ncbi:MAG: hypothetical protein ACD_58C00269G0002 [uncultured bacterium]|nr:MAG: hypothetical protein ACD_58C00269G0002 [uncultured bacterium]